MDGREREATSHEVDHVKSFANYTCALEIEWNNKDPFFDRDLESFKRLHTDGALSLGIIVTRGVSLQESLRPAIAKFARRKRLQSLDDLRHYYAPTDRQRKLIEKQTQAKGSFAEGWAHVFVADKFGEATTHWAKLMDRVQRGVGNPCPLLLMGIPKGVLCY